MSIALLTVASSSNFPKSSFSSLTSSWAVHCEARLVKPTMSANRMLDRMRGQQVMVIHTRPYTVTPTLCFVTTCNWLKNCFIRNMLLYEHTVYRIYWICWIVFMKTLKSVRLTQSTLRKVWSLSRQIIREVSIYALENKGASRCHIRNVLSKWFHEGSSDYKKVRKRWFFKEPLTEWFFVEPKMVLVWHRLKNLLKQLYF